MSTDIELFFLLFLLPVTIIFPMVILIHELGHAFAALLLTKENVIVIIGDSKVKDNPPKFSISWRWGRLRYVILPFRYYGFCNVKFMMEPRYIPILISAAGPIASLLLSLLMWLIAVKFPSQNETVNLLLKGVALYSLWLFIVSAIPIRYPSWWGAMRGRFSDGGRIVYILKYRPEENIQITEML